MTATATLEITRRPTTEITAEGLRIFNDPAVASVNYEAGAVEFIDQQIRRHDLERYFRWQA